MILKAKLSKVEHVDQPVVSFENKTKSIQFKQFADSKIVACFKNKESEELFSKCRQNGKQVQILGRVNKNW